jgi:3-deoxy-D-manno-octulosonic-acid transferase
MIVFLYNILLLLALAVSWPWWVLQYLTKEKFREGLLERLGGVRPELHAASSSDSRRVVWLHAVSLGEVLAIARLVGDLDNELPQYRVMISTTTRTGQWAARARFGAERVFYCPIDLPWATRAYLNALRPAMLVLAETEFWPNLLTGCFRRSVPVVVVNGRISDRSWPRYLRLRRLWQPMLRRITATLAQSELDAKRLRVLGCEPVAVAGNLKFDVRPGQIPEVVGQLAAARGELRLVVAGSTLEGEEAALLAAWPAILAAASGTAMVLAPRHPERFAAVAELVAKSGFPWRRRTVSLKGSLVPGEIVLLDSIGELATVYSLATVAFVGGSLVAAGGHNPLEPAYFSVPVVMGPHYENFRAIMEAMISQNALRITAESELAATLGALLSDPNEAAALGARGAQVFDQQAGATYRASVVIGRLLQRRALGRHR